MIVVVVGEEHRDERRKLLDSHWDRVKPPRAGERDRGCALSEDRIGEHALAVDFEQHRAVSEPGDAKALWRGRRRPRLEWALDGQRSGRSPGVAAEDEFADDRQRGALEREG